MTGNRPRKISNVGVLDLRQASAETVADGLECDNIGTIIFSRKSAALLDKVKAKNIGATIECEDDMQIVSGRTELTASRLSGTASPISLLVMGKIVVHPDVSADALDRGVSKVHVFGKIECPDHLASVLQSKIGELNGKLSTYPGDHTLIDRSLELNDTQLRSLQDGARLAVLGSVTVGKGTANDLLRQKIASLWVERRVTVFESNSDEIAMRLHGSSPGNVEVIPDAFEIIDEAARFDNSDVQSWNQESLYFLQRVEFARDVDPELVKRNLVTFKACSEVLCHNDLKPVLMQKCDKHKTKVIGYADAVIVNDGQSRLRASQLERVQVSVAILNEGVLQCEAIDPALIASKIEKIYNQGVITAPKDIVGELESKAVVNSGVITDSDSALQEGDAATAEQSNVAMLRL